MPEKYIRNPNAKCAVCSKSIYRRPSQIKCNYGSVFCSLACSAISQRKETPCIVCNTPILAGFHKKTCSRSCANIHRAGIVYGTGAKKDKVKSQRAVKLRVIETREKRCERCGYDKIEILQVHHKDRNKF